MTAREEPLLEAPVFRESTLVPSVLKRRYARLYTCAIPSVCHSVEVDCAAGHFAGSCKATILPVTVGGPNLVCGAARDCVLKILLPFPTSCAAPNLYLRRLLLPFQPLSARHIGLVLTLHSSWHQSAMQARCVRRADGCTTAAGTGWAQPGRRARRT